MYHHEIYHRHPPFDIEYNTQLIADEAIAMALHQVAFSDSQLRIILSNNTRSLVDSIFDQSSIVMNHDGNECRIVCIGDILCSDSYLMIKPTSEIVDGDRSVVSSFKKQYITKPYASIDTRELSNLFAESTDIEDILIDIADGVKAKMAIDVLIDKLSIKSHIQLVEWAIKSACDFAIHNVKVKNIDLLIPIVEYYKITKLVFCVGDLEYTKIYDRYKKYSTTTSNGWWSKTTKPSLSSLPVGHLIGDAVSVYQFSDKTWLSLSSISTSKIDDKHPFGWYIYDEQIDHTMNVATKIKFESIEKKRGITMLFLQKSELAQIAKALKISIPVNEQKKDTVDRIVTAAIVTQKKIYPKRIIYRLIDM